MKSSTQRIFLAIVVIALTASMTGCGGGMFSGNLSSSPLGLGRSSAAQATRSSSDSIPNAAAVGYIPGATP